MSSTDPADATALRAALRKAMPTAALHRIPKHPQRRDLILAAISSSIERRYPYNELELKETLEEILDRFRASVDHVTCRRYLVDCGFLKRDRAGSRYYLNYQKLSETLTEAARAAVDEFVAEALQAGEQRSMPPPATQRK